MKKLISMIICLILYSTASFALGLQQTISSQQFTGQYSKQSIMPQQKKDSPSVHALEGRQVETTTTSSDTLPRMKKDTIRMHKDSNVTDTANVPLKDGRKKAWKFKKRNANMTNPYINTSKDTTSGKNKNKHTKVWDYKDRNAHITHPSDSTKEMPQE